MQVFKGIFDWNSNQSLNTGDSVSFSELNIDNEGFQTGNGIDTVSLQAVSIDIRAKVEENGDNNLGQLSNIRFSDTAAICPRIYNLRSRGSKATPAIVQDGDIVNCLVQGAYDGAEYRVASLIRTTIDDSSPALGDISAKLSFFVSTGTTYEEILTLDKDKKASFSGSISSSVGNLYATDRQDSLSADVTLTNTSEEYQMLNPNGADRDVTAEATPVQGRRYVVKNIGSANTLQFKNNGGTTIGNPIAIGVAVTFLYDNTEWQVV